MNQEKEVEREGTVVALEEGLEGILQLLLLQMTTLLIQIQIQSLNDEERQQRGFHFTSASGLKEALYDPSCPLEVLKIFLRDYGTY